MCGAMTDEIKPVKEIIDEMLNDAEAELQRLNGIFNQREISIWNAYNI